MFLAKREFSAVQHEVPWEWDGYAQVIAVICILVWVINIRRFADPVHGSWVRDFSHSTVLLRHFGSSHWHAELLSRYMLYLQLLLVRLPE